MLHTKSPGILSSVPVVTKRVEHWVRTIHFYAPKSAIFLVGTHRDNLSTKGTKQLSGKAAIITSKFFKALKRNFIQNSIRCRKTSYKEYTL